VHSSFKKILGFLVSQWSLHQGKQQGLSVMRSTQQELAQKLFSLRSPDRRI
jgi:hypothetical protein